MSNVRPAGWPVVPSKTPSVPAKTGAATRAAFFQAALTETAPTRPAVAPSTVQLQTQAQQRAAPQKPFVQPDAQPQKILRPGSLLNILV